MNALQQIGRRC